MSAEKVRETLQNLSTEEILETLQILVQTLEERLTAPLDKERSKLIHELHGKYQHVPTSSDAFSLRKQEEKASDAI